MKQLHAWNAEKYLYCGLQQQSYAMWWDFLPTFQGKIKYSSAPVIELVGPSAEETAPIPSRSRTGRWKSMLEVLLIGINRRIQEQLYFVKAMQEQTVDQEAIFPKARGIYYLVPGAGHTVQGMEACSKRPGASSVAVSDTSGGGTDLDLTGCNSHSQYSRSGTSVCNYSSCICSPLCCWGRGPLVTGEGCRTPGTALCTNAWKRSWGSPVTAGGEWWIWHWAWRPACFWPLSAVQEMLPFVPLKHLLPPFHPLSRAWGNQGQGDQVMDSKVLMFLGGIWSVLF